MHSALIRAMSSSVVFASFSTMVSCFSVGKVAAKLSCSQARYHCIYGSHSPSEHIRPVISPTTTPSSSHASPAQHSCDIAPHAGMVADWSQTPPMGQKSRFATHTADEHRHGSVSVPRGSVVPVIATPALGSQSPAPHRLACSVMPSPVAAREAYFAALWSGLVPDLARIR